VSDEVRQLAVELTEAQTVLRQILAADRRTPLDALPRRELN